MVDESLIARIYTVDKNGYDRVGTGYPIASDLLVTALHVVSYPDQNKSKGVFVVWDGCEKDDEELTIDSIVFDGSSRETKCDVAILKCPTPLPTRLLLSPNAPPHKTGFLCRGYPLAGLHKSRPKHDALRFSGNTEGDHKELHIELTTTTNPVEPEDNEVNGWSGLSGAPLIIDKQLAGVITSQYKTVERRLFAVSFPYLLKHDEVFRELVQPQSEALIEYKQSRQQDLTALLEGVRKDVLPCCEALIQEFKLDHTACVSRLTDKLSGELSHLNDGMLQKLLNLLLTQIDILGCEKSSDHIYNLGVGTQLLSEVAVANIYQAEPSFQDVESGIKGEHVIPASLTETGFMGAVQAEDQARAVSHAVYKKINKKGDLKEIHSEIAIERYKKLNAVLARLREKGITYRFEIDPAITNDADYPLMNPETRSHLKKELLPQLLIVFYGEDYAFEEEASLELEVGFYMEELKRRNNK